MDTILITALASLAGAITVLSQPTPGFNQTIPEKIMTLDTVKTRLGTLKFVDGVPEKNWFALFRLYGPLEPWFDQTWRPGEIELLE